MAVIPQMPGVSPSGAGAIAAPMQPYQQAGEAGTPGGQGAAIGGGLRQLGQDVGTAADIAARDVLREQAMSNEAMARDADSEAATTMANDYNEFASLEGEKAVAAKDGFMARMNARRKDALDLMPNQQARQMLDSVLTRRAGFYQEAIGRYAAGEQKKWQARSAAGAAAVATDQAAVFRYDPEKLDKHVESGVGNVLALGEIHGWDEQTESAEVAKYKGQAYAKVISQMLGDNNVNDAVATFERVKDGLDAASQAQISQMLLPQQRRQRTEQNYQRFIGQGAVANLPADAIARAEVVAQEFMSLGYTREVAYGLAANAVQESGANPRPGRGDGGRSVGLFQWNDSRREAFKTRYGIEPDEATVQQQVAFADWELKNTERNAGDALKGAKTAEEAAAIASERFLRPRDTAREGPRRAAIASRLTGRDPGLPTYEKERPDFSGARERAAAELDDDPEELQRTMARINQGEAQYNSTTKAERGTLDVALKNTQAMLADGREVAIPETDIRRLYPRDEADTKIAELVEIRQQGNVYRSLQFASPSERAALLASYDDVGKAPGGTDAEVQAGYAQRAKSREIALAVAKRVDEQIKKDPAAYALQSPAVAAYAAADALAAPGGQEAYARATLGEQERLGVPEADRRVLPKAQIASLVQQITQADPEKVPAALVLGQLGQKFGEAWPAVFRDMVRGGLPKPYAILGSMSHPDQVGARGDAQRMVAIMSDEKRGGMAALRTNVVGGAISAKSIDDGLDAALAQFQETSRFMLGGADLYATTREFVKGMAYYYAGQGASPNKALAQAVGGVLNAKYDFDGSMRVPKGMLGLAKEVTSDIQAQLGAAALAAVPEGPMAETQRARLTTAAQNGFWVPNADDTGLMLMAQYRNGPAGIPVYEPVRGADGAHVSVRFDQMDALRNTATTRNTERRGALSARPPIDALGNPVLVAPR